MKTLATLAFGLAAIALAACGGSDSKTATNTTPSAITPNSTATASATVSSSVAATTSTASPTAIATAPPSATATTAAPTVAPTQGSAATPVPPTSVPPTPVPPPPPTPTQAAGAPSSATVSANALTFSPTSVTVRAGGTITWVWTVSQFHNIAVDGFAPSSTTNTGPFSQTFDGAGTYAYHCEIHPDTMRGTVNVQ